MKNCFRSGNVPTICQTLGLVLAFILAAGAPGEAKAKRINTGNRDLAIRWDNSIRVTGGWRMQNPDSLIINNPASDESDSKFDKHDMVTARVDLLSELDVVYKRKHGFRVSAQFWYDHAYHDTRVRQNPDLAALGIPSSYENNRYSDFTRKWYKGVSGELLDAFFFSGVNLGKIPVNLKLGQHTLYWGQALFYMGGISYSQSGLDMRKGIANPGSGVKELFLPVNQFSFQAQVTRNVSVAGQYFFDWDYYRAPEGGTYLSPVDFIMDGSDRMGVPPLAYLPRSAPVVPDSKNGNWGLDVKWQPEFMRGGRLAVTYRNFDEKIGWLLMSPDYSSYHAVFPRNTEIFGLSVDGSVGRLSVAAEIAYRKNAGLKTPALAPVPEGARGNVWHAAVNAVYLLPTTSLWSNGSLAVEIYGGHLDKITKNEALFQGVGYAACRNPLTGVPGSGNKFDGCATTNALGMSVKFTPQWQEVFPSIDLAMPVSVSYGISGNEADLTSGNQDSYTFGIGLEADIFRRYKAMIAYYGYQGKISRVVNGAYASTNGGTALLKDRGWLALTFKTTF